MEVLLHAHDLKFPLGICPEVNKPFLKYGLEVKRKQDGKNPFQESLSVYVDILKNARYKFSCKRSTIARVEVDTNINPRDMGNENQKMNE